MNRRETEGAAVYIFDTKAIASLSWLTIPRAFVVGRVIHSYSLHSFTLRF